MILFVNGNFHVAAAMAENPYITACDDNEFMLLERRPHPDNFDVSWGKKLSELLKFNYETSPYFSEDNNEIIKTTKDWIVNNAGLFNMDIFIIIGWNTIESKEEANEIFNFHLLLKEHNAKHIFFDTYEKIPLDYDFGENYIDVPYDVYLKENGYEPVITSNMYYGKKAHSEWMTYLLKWIVKYNMV